MQPWQSAQIAKVVVDHYPEQLKLPFYLCTREAVAQLIRRRFGIKLSEWTVGRYLARWGFTPQKTARRALKQNPQEVRLWLERKYPEIRRLAKREKAQIFWGDEMGLRSDHAAGRSYGLRGQTPVIHDTGQRFGNSATAGPHEQGLSRKLELLLDRCGDSDEGSQGIAQLIASETLDRTAAFAFATYAAGLAGRLPVGAEGRNDLGRIAAPLFDVEGEIAWQERLGEKGTSHPQGAAIGALLAPLREGRLARARQFLTACLLRDVPVGSPRELEDELDRCVELLRERELAGEAA